METNLSKQIDFFQEAKVSFNQIAWKRFVLNAFRMNEERNLRGKQVLLCYFLFDFQLGKMKYFTRYELISLEQAKERVLRRLVVNIFVLTIVAGFQSSSLKIGVEICMLCHLRLETCLQTLSIVERSSHWRLQTTFSTN